MVGRKTNLKSLMLKLREVGATIVKTTEFVQGQTCRWGIAWSFVPPAKKIVSTDVAEKKSLSFMLQVYCLPNLLIELLFSANLILLNSHWSFFVAFCLMAFLKLKVHLLGCIVCNITLSCSMSYLAR